jgi:hypothetical protein
MKYNVLILILLYFGLGKSNTPKQPLANTLKYEVNRVYAPLSISRERLNKANTLIDINRYYKASWVKEYISVEILATHKGQVKKVISKNNILSKEQKSIMQKADVGTAMEVRVLYFPENNLKHNEAKENNFSFIVNPENKAKYAGGDQKLNEYLDKNAIGKIPNDLFKGYDLAAVKFTINEKGQIINQHVFESSKDEKIDQLLLKVISDMPNWKPAEYANGTKVSQEFVLTIGNHESCIINTLNIGRLSNGDKID